MHLLHLDSSARRDSISRRLGEEFRSTFVAAEPRAAVTYRDLCAPPIPPITEAWTRICDNLLRDQIADLDDLHRGARTAEEKVAWAVVAPLLAELVAADVVLLTAPMYNFGIPAALKAWIDQVTFPRMNLGHRRFVVVGAQGGSYAPGRPRAPMEHHLRYLSDFIFGHYSVPEPLTVVAELSNARVDPVLAQFKGAHEDSVAAALASVRSAAREVASLVEAR
ncbi:FMN-dependent NADH-azoreductase [Nocardioides antri]|uniref:FMN dependent NADH:quinone oxidoreductase n=1 Tax=Nocardioides antri TaxID=2607659 RepID=A0A5B1M218_9ACTN|nr:NAD(P)H-dependent oxidoreductase [Nocardioides antri]KAA1425790.1 FMN-dependent NADH-azoreductase [Nocardioides antri]